MLHATSLAILATLAASALAAPTPFKAVSHIPQTFKFDVKPRFSASRTPFQELVYTYAKYGWQIIIVDPSNPFASMFGGDDGSSSSIPAPAATTSSAASTETGSADSANTPASAGTPTLTTVTTLVSVVASSTSPATSAATSAANSATTTASGESGKVTASPEKNDSEYLSPVTIGGQALTLDFDTGSADLWVFSSSLPAADSSGHTTFDPSKSSTWQAYQGATWQISYGDGSAADGTVGFDAVTIGGVTVSKQAVELATGVSGSFVQDTQNDGLVGLGFSTINTVQPQPQKTFFENVMPSLALPVFTANLDKDASGTYTFGAIDSTQYTGDIHYTPVDSSNGFWEFPSSSYTIAGGSPTPCTTCSPAIADTGTSLMLIDDDIVTAYYAQVSGSSLDQSQGGYIYPCSATLPSFGVAIGADYTATIPGSALTFAELGDGTCFGGVQSNQGQGIQIYGDVLLRNFFAVFDGGAKRFGVATKA
ncbi:hypothetical protein B0A55_08483 [Friedmanniomyces simplex]|uniref:Peptidase A1 domain-containing protein n=1 Tax=Friedmanniomyces simplex TaxID=329884 RepID=A0A4U0X143_9PEZI|nr:hypothetical protein B0A55_08483 [Friedmanniomyces simplex]